MDNRRGEGLAWAAYVVLLTAVAAAAVVVLADSPATGIDALAFAVACAQLGVLGASLVLTREPPLIADGGRAQSLLAQASAVVVAIAVLTVAGDVPLGGLETVAMIAVALLGVGSVAANLLGLTDRPGDLALSLLLLLLVATASAGGLSSSDATAGEVVALAFPLALGLAAIGALVLFVFGYALRAAAGERA